jgi:hypothetical protein
MKNYNFNLTGPKELINSLRALELDSFILCLSAYNNLLLHHKEQITDIGFNPVSQYIYIVMDSGIAICSRRGKSVIYCIDDFEFDTYFELLEFCQSGKISE